ncbi:MAG: phosphoribosylformylglycinamidine synthase II [SAR202 cluster bacterium Io17-Chloro-G9]|nr:MAG: phosphoribosylformylglycinamidine synthase II [SAR202 cluster bacterium Io17-Chloro-G9]
MLDEIALSRAEYDRILDLLDRDPNPVELGMFGALWSEHCGYKHSRPLLKFFPSQSPKVLSQQGAENAGAVDIGDGLAVVFKVESHNHPSAVEPHQGAATGVGGIVRDILAMGARPIALLNSLRFGLPSDPQTMRLFQGVVGGISWYGNCLGIPDVAGEVYFDASYAQNPLVNAMCVGLVRKDAIATAAAGQAGNVLLLVGAGTGRDGIHGASGLASRTFEEEQELRPTVQVGNPFLEKVLIEACLEALETGDVLAIQDLGAAGLTSAAIESAYRAGRGVSLDISQVHRRESGMTGYEVMLSESQERMILVMPPDETERVEKIFERWDVPCHRIGEVISQQTALVSDGPQQIASVPVKHLVAAPQYRLKGVPNGQYKQRQSFSMEQVPLPPEGPSDTLLKLLASPNIASKESVYRQYDHQVQTNTVVGPGSDAAVLRIKGTGKAIALSIDGNSRYCYLDPYRGGQIAVAEVCRNLSCVGAEPLALTDCLNFGNPERPDVYYQLEWCIRGMARACRFLGVPVVSGNVSLYNESRGQAIYPTPVLGGLGLLEEATQHCQSAFPADGLTVALLGRNDLRPRKTDLAGSEYLQVIHGLVAGRPALDLSLEFSVQELCRRAIKEGVVASAHDCSDGGLAVAVAESCIQGEVGFTSTVAFPRRWDMTLFGEGQSRIVISVPSEKWSSLEAMASESGVPVLRLGTTGGTNFKWGPQLDLAISDLADSWRSGLNWA